MKRKLLVIPFISACFPVLADVGMDKRQMSIYAGAIACLDRTFYDGGYDEGDKTREALMSDFLAMAKLPAYDEKLYEAARKAKHDTSDYMEGYYLCNDNETYLLELAEKYGISLPEE